MSSSVEIHQQKYISLKRETEKAICFTALDDESVECDYWIPLSTVHVINKAEKFIRMDSWIARQKGLVSE